MIPTTKMLDRTLAPPFQRSSAFDLHQHKKNTLSNGVPLYLVSGGDQDVLKVELTAQAGRSAEETRGAAYFSAQLLSKGTSRKSSFDIAQIFDRFGAHLEISAGLDFASISLYSLTRNLEPALYLLQELLTDATFPDKELAQIQSIYLQNLRVNNEKTSFLASKLFRRTLFGEYHPYGTELDEKDVNSLTREHLAMHSRRFHSGLIAFASGKIDAKSETLLNTVLGTLPAQPGATATVAQTEGSLINQYQQKEGSVQASIRMGKKSVMRSHPDYADVLFLSHILGGYFGSRLMKNIREEKGLTYGIHASLHALLQDSYIAIGTDVNKENVQLTIDEIKKELRRLREEPIDSNELETAQNHFIGGLQSELTTAFAHADKIKTITLFGLDHAYYNNLIARIGRISAPDIQRIAEQYFSEDSFLEVVVG
jgi:zinc protease